MRRASPFLIVIVILLTLAAGGSPSGLSHSAAGVDDPAGWRWAISGPIDDPAGWRWAASDPTGWRWD